MYYLTQMDNQTAVYGRLTDIARKDHFDSFRQDLERHIDNFLAISTPALIAIPF